MVIKCVVPSCTVNITDPRYKLFKIPTVRLKAEGKTRKLAELRQILWMRAVNLSKSSPASYHRICSRHFIHGKPALFEDTRNVDWVPTINLPFASIQVKNSQEDLLARPLRAELGMCDDSVFSNDLNSEPQTNADSVITMRCESFPQSILGGYRKENANIEINTSQSIKHNHVNKTPQHRSQCKQAQSPLFNLPTIVDENDSGLMNITQIFCEASSYDVSTASSSPISENNGFVRSLISSSECYPLETLPGKLYGSDVTEKIIFYNDECTQTDTYMEKDVREMGKALNRGETLIRKLEAKHDQLKQALIVSREATRLGVSSLQNNDKKCKYFTGISSGLVVKHLFVALENDLPVFNEMSKEKLLVLAFRKLRLNEPFCTLAYIYNLSPSTIANYFYETLNSIFPFMKGLVRFPSRTVLQSHTPLSFQRKYGNSVTVILDCFEVNVESPNPKKMPANANVYSNYKCHKTVKVLVGISTAGSIIYISEAFGGRISDKEIVKQSAFLDKLEDGDFILADRGFLIDELLTSIGASVAYPAFKKKNKQLEPLDAISSRELSSLRIHVERLIGVLRQKFLILWDTIPITLLQRWNNDTPVIDQILQITSAMTNLCPSVVPQ